MSLPKRLIMQNIRIVLHLKRKATDLTPPVKPSVVGTLDGKAGTKDPVEVVTDPNTKVELLDKDGNVIGSVRQIVRVMRQLHQRCLFLKVTSL